MPTNITMPALSPTMTEGNLAKWHKAEGDTVEAGDVIAEIETDKATMEVEAVDEGVLGKILINEGTEAVAVNTPIAVLLEDGESADDIDDVSVAEPPPPQSSPPRGEEETAQQVQEGGQKPEPAPVSRVPSPDKSDRIFASPLARRIAKDKGIDLSAIKGSGPRGRIVKADVTSYKVQGSSAASQENLATGNAHLETTNEFGQVYSEIPVNNIQKITAKRLLESKTTVPHFYLTIECVLDNLLAARKEINAAADGEYKVSVNDFIIKANAMALQAYPAANTSWQDERLIQFRDSDISVAVATPNGLITPIVKNAQTKGLKEISAEVKELAGKAREGKLQPSEFQGGSFTVSNLGMYGIKEFGAIINPPQSCIMAVGAGEQKPVVENGEIKIRTVMSVTLSTDHRSVDGAVGAEYLQYFKKYIENPVMMLV